MTSFDRYLAGVRVRRALACLPPGSRTLDIGAFDGELFARGAAKGIHGIGVDPAIAADKQLPNAAIYRDSFPTSRDIGRFDCLTALAVLEHIPSNQQSAFASACAAALEPGGLLVLTVPSPHVDTILAVLLRLRLVDGMSAEQHYGFDVRKTPALFTGAGMRLVRHEHFQLGLNNLFVFEKAS